MNTRRSRPQGKLTNGIVRGLHSLEREYKTADGGGLQVAVTPAGRKRWLLQLEHAGKQRTLSLGEYPTVKVEVARALREEFLEKCRLHGWERAVEVLHRRVDAWKRVREPHAEPPLAIDRAKLVAKFFGISPPSAHELHRMPRAPKEERNFGDWDGRKLRPNPGADQAWRQQKSSAEFPTFTGRVTVRRRKVP